MNIYYKNHTGQTVDLMEWPYMIFSSDLHDYGWSYENKNSLNPKISRFYRELVNHKVEISISAKTPEEYNKALEYLLEVTERDILNLSYGRLYVDQYYLPCYIVKSKKTGWKEDVAFLNNAFTLVSEKGAWVRENKFLYSAKGAAGSGQEEDPYMDYPYGHPYDYASNILGSFIRNQGFTGAEFELTVYGPCREPQISIGGYPYRVDCELQTGEVLKIDSLERKVFKRRVNGEEVNQFHLRDREHSVFRRIPEGVSTVSWDGGFPFDIVLFEERSEPGWT